MLLDTAIAISRVPLINLAAAFLGGLLPVFIWLWFLEHEDKNPEPKRLITLAFVCGMLSVPIAIQLENLVGQNTSYMTVILWATIEEVIKYTVALIVVLRRKDNDEPIDSMIYLIAVALGFASVENFFFILGTFLQNGTSQAIITANLRFVGSTLLHTVASSIVGGALALSFYRSERIKNIYLVIGLILAITLHTLFNLSIILSGGTRAVFAFYMIWAALVATLLFFEKAKTIRRYNQ